MTAQPQPRQSQHSRTATASGTSALITRLKLPFHYAKLGMLIVQCKFLLFWAAARNGFRTNRVLTVPDKPSPWSAFYKICHLLGYSFTSDIDAPADLVFAWQDRTIREPCPSLDRLAQRGHVVNYECRDISKSQLAAAFAQVFGYGLAVNPAEHHGLMVRKSNDNAPHDGIIIEGPVIANPRFAYQKVVNNIVDGFVVDIRVPVFREIIPHCLVKRIALAHRFTNKVGTSVIHRPSDVLSAIELDLLLQFCRAIGMEYGELDVLRDQEDGRIYIVDANHTPFGPLSRDIQVRWYFDPQSWRALKYLAGAFRAAFVDDRRVETRSS